MKYTYQSVGLHVLSYGNNTFVLPVVQRTKVHLTVQYEYSCTRYSTRTWYLRTKVLSYLRTKVPS